MLNIHRKRRTSDGVREKGQVCKKIKNCTYSQSKRTRDLERSYRILDVVKHIIHVRPTIICAENFEHGGCILWMDRSSLRTRWLGPDCLHHYRCGSSQQRHCESWHVSHGHEFLRWAPPILIKNLLRERIKKLTVSNAPAITISRRIAILNTLKAWKTMSMPRSPG